MYETIGPDNDRSPTQPLHLEPDELPMVVWLTGNEPYFGAFCLDADTVMVRLGLRRSRLTQISGKELRVGRAKIGRYIRPMYRDCDVESYLAWVKPTASHKKSSSVIEEAVQHLETQTEVSLRNLQTLLGDFSAQTRAIFGQQLAKQTAQLQTNLLHQRQEIVRPITAQLAHDTHINLRIETELATLQTCVEKLAIQQGEFLAMQEALTRILSLLQMQQAASSQHGSHVEGELAKLRAWTENFPVQPLVTKSPVFRWYPGSNLQPTPAQRPSLQHRVASRSNRMTQKSGYGMPIS